MRDHHYMNTPWDGAMERDTMDFVETPPIDRASELRRLAVQHTVTFTVSQAKLEADRAELVWWNAKQHRRATASHFYFQTVMCVLLPGAAIAVRHDLSVSVPAVLVAACAGLLAAVLYRPHRRAVLRDRDALKVYQHAAANAEGVSL